ncbi:MAG TPA: SbcC/MukB-like Walker B domain-containing protein [Terracidiphilus sp.]|nr:SbcC/MukB-like Walker B domain-containing protein [Terracidiphilus sp.]
MEKAAINSRDHGAWRLSGYRLDRLELLNWGTFHGEGQVFTPRGEWSLLVGDNGSGKSTAIDAIRTLLVPPRLLASSYNDASGDGRKSSGRDRTRRSYIRGAWASSSTIDSTSPTTQYLREPGVLSAIAAVFADELHSESVTVAQVLWEFDENVREIFAICRLPKSLKDLLGQQTNTSDIKRAAKQSGWEVFDSFPSYSERMRKLLHIPGEKALEVFNRAIGMKEVGDIDAFVRQFLLPSADTFSFIRDTLQPHYKTLMDCWTAIDRAERQLNALRPVSENADRVAAAESKIKEWKDLQDAVKPYFLTKYLLFLESRLAETYREHQIAQTKRNGLASNLDQRRNDRDELIVAISATDVGPRLQAIDREIELSEGERLRAQTSRSRVQSSAALLEAQSALSDEAAFLGARSSWESIEIQESIVASESEERRATCRVRQENTLIKMLDVREELTSVESNKVNIPRHFLLVRLRLCEALNVDINTMPFAGELIEVRPEYAEWAGAIERLLRGFGLSLLVPEDFYRPAAQFINSTMLNLRLVFHSVPARVPVPPRLSDEFVPGRLSFRVDHDLHSWVVVELARRFDYRCCETIAELEKVAKGLTRQGLTRDRSRHVKDDSRPIDDPKDRILGWSTEQKIAALRAQLSELEKQAEEAAHDSADAASAAISARSRAAAARDLLGVRAFLEINPDHWSERLIRLRSDKELLESSSKELHLLRQRKIQVESEIADLEQQLRKMDGEVHTFERDLSTCNGVSQARRAELNKYPDYEHSKTEADFARIVGPHAALTMDNVDQLTHTTSQSIQGRISNETGKVNEAAENMVVAMSEFLKEFPEFGQTLRPGRTYADSFLALLRKIEEEDLPKHRERFEYFLNENLVGDLLMLQSRLEQHREAIESRVDEVNQALQSIEYRENTYVQLRLVSQPNIHVNEFRRSLKECFEHGIAPAPEERLRVFARVRDLLEKFQADPDGTQRVTDARNWYCTGVKELRLQDDSEVDFFAATTGKSGGQKAKLAFTILASALSAQYGLSQAEPDSSNFRLVVIDEAFSRTDEENSQRAMQLFANLGFQVVIVGPFDAKAKLAVPFVRTIHLASNPTGDKSQLLAITRQELESGDFERLEAGGALATQNGPLPETIQ